ncbi:MAG: dethiobiotin synthase [Nitrospiraceae bacterium]|nr:MAG: dethiobiotin synthase [Nitrospiraceae bacterium]
MFKGIFITGTDTGVGKTFVTIGLLRAIKKLGYTVCPMKPVETGCGTLNGRLVPADALKLVCAAEADEPLNLINPYRFRQPLAPAVAAELERVVINKEKILSAYRQLSKRYDITIVEGAGGIMVPIYKKYLFIDLIKDLGLPLIIVASPGLGTINHTLLTIDAAKKNGIKVTGVIINHSIKIRDDVSVKTNPEVIEKLGGTPVLGVVPYSGKPDSLQLRKIFNRIAEKITSLYLRISL